MISVAIRINLLYTSSPCLWFRNPFIVFLCHGILLVDRKSFLERVGQIFSLAVDYYHSVRFSHTSYNPFNRLYPKLFHYRFIELFYIILIQDILLPLYKTVSHNFTSSYFTTISGNYFTEIFKRVILLPPYKLIFCHPTNYLLLFYQTTR